MKTPRDILFDRHRAAVPLLDGIRAEILSRLSPRNAAPRGSILFAAACKLWEELVWPCRRAWTRFAVVWIALLGVHLATPREVVKAAPLTASALDQRRQLLAELLPLPHEELRRRPVLPPPQARRREACGEGRV